MMFAAVTEFLTVRMEDDDTKKKHERSNWEMCSSEPRFGEGLHQ